MSPLCIADRLHMAKSKEPLEPLEISAQDSCANDEVAVEPFVEPKVDRTAQVIAVMLPPHAIDWPHFSCCRAFFLEAVPIRCSSSGCGLLLPTLDFDFVKSLVHPVVKGSLQFGGCVTKLWHLAGGGGPVASGGHSKICQEYLGCPAPCLHTRHCCGSGSGWLASVQGVVIALERAGGFA